MVKTRNIQKYIVQLIVECFATCILIVFGEAGIANYKFARPTCQSIFPIALTFGIGIYTGNIMSKK
jgi:glycerol uptake facilitator-like aquaporin